MSDAIVSTVIGMVGTGLIGVFYMQLQNLRDDLRQGFRDQGDSIKSLETAVVQLKETAKGHGERLARIEAKLDNKPPAEAA